jgi:hypothetical protein
MSLAILNVGEGDTKITFDKDNPKELERSRRIVTDMLKLGYAILVRISAPDAKPKYRRAVGFDPTLDEYIVTDVPAEPQTGLDDGVPIGEPAPVHGNTGKRGRRRRLPASTPAIGVSRSAGGMSDAVDSVEMQNLERFDDWARERNALRLLSEVADEWAGLPMPLEGTELVIDPKHRAASVFKRKEEPIDEEEAKCVMRNRFYSIHKRREVYVWSEPDGKIQWGLHGTVHHFNLDMETMAASVAWGVEQEGRAVQMLATLLPHHAFKKYLLTGMFVEQSERSGVYYFFRRLKPTVAASGATGDMKIIAVLCQHPIAYYAGTWAGAMCPTDDVIAHLSLMRGDEALYWRRCNQHPAFKPEAGL